MGSSWIPRLGSRRGPLRASASVLGVESTTHLSLWLYESEAWPMDMTISAQSYVAAFEDVVSAVHLELLRLDPALPPQPAVMHEPITSAVDRRTQLSTLGRKLTPAVARRPEYALLRHEDRQATIGMAVVEDLLHVMAAVSSDPNIPPGLAERLVQLHEELVPLVRTGAIGPLLVDERTTQLVDFVYRQMILRRALPERELHRCLECGYERLVNPESSRASERRRLRSTVTVISSSAAGLLLGSTSSVISLAGRLAAISSGDSGFRCTRCQGSSCETLPATICPLCRKIQAQPVLRNCLGTDCDFSFESVSDQSLRWDAIAGDGVNCPEGKTRLTSIGRNVGIDFAAFARKERIANESASASASPTPPAAEGNPTGVLGQHLSSEPNWYPDPSGRWLWRWWDGGRWGAWVSAGDGVCRSDLMWN